MDFDAGRHCASYEHIGLPIHVFATMRSLIFRTGSRDLFAPTAQGPGTNSPRFADQHTRGGTRGHLVFQRRPLGCEEQWVGMRMGGCTQLVARYRGAPVVPWAVDPSCGSPACSTTTKRLRS